MNKLNPIKVKISNFQSIDNVEIDIAGFTCITGKTNIGKSAIIRAISKSILNDPVIGLVRNGKSHSTIEISHDSWSFKWEKGEKGINRYEIGSRTLDKTGQKQIEDIKNIGFSSIKMGDDEIQPWFAPQFGPIFLLDKSGPQVTDFISSVSGLNVLQDAIVLASRGRKRSVDEAKMKTAEGTKAKDKLSKFVGIEILQKQVADLKDQRKSVGELKERIDSAIEFNTEIQNIKEDIRLLEIKTDIDIPELIGRENIQKYSEAQVTLNEMKSLAVSMISLKSLISINIPEINPSIYNNINSYKEFVEISPLMRDVEELKKVVSVKLIDNLDSISREVKHVENMGFLNDEAKFLAKEIISIMSIPEIPKIEIDRDEISDLKNMVEFVREFNQIEEESGVLELKIGTLATRISEIEKEIEKIPTCPTCGQEMSGSKSKNHYHDMHI